MLLLPQGWGTSPQPAAACEADGTQQPWINGHQLGQAFTSTQRDTGMDTYTDKNKSGWVRAAQPLAIWKGREDFCFYPIFPRNCHMSGRQRGLTTHLLSYFQVSLLH